MLNSTDVRRSAFGAAIIAAAVSASIAWGEGGDGADMVAFWRQGRIGDVSVPVTGGRPLDLQRARVAAAVDRAADRHGVPRRLAHAIVKVESGYRPDALGPPTKWGRACGPTQMLPSTASTVAGRPVSCQELRSNPDVAVDLGVRYVRQGLDRHGGDHAAAAEFYFGGPVLRGPKSRAYAAKVTSLAGPDGWLSRRSALPWAGG